jgi:hypothetical protein
LLASSPGDGSDRIRAGSAAAAAVVAGAASPGHGQVALKPSVALRLPFPFLAAAMVMLIGKLWGIPSVRRFEAGQMDTPNVII